VEDIYTGIPGIISKIIFKRPLIIRYCFRYDLKWKVNTLLKRVFVLLFCIMHFIYEFFTFKFSNKILGHVPYLNNRLVRFSSKHKSIYIPNYVDTVKFKPDLDVKQHNFTLYVGRLDKVKNIHLMLYVFNLLKNEDLELLIVGGGNSEYERKLQIFSKKNDIKVRFLGKINHKQISYYYKISKYFLFLSEREGGSKALLEALSSGLVVIGTNVRGIRDVITHGYNGFLCDPFPEKIAEQIKVCLNNQALCEKISKNAQEYILKNHTFDNIIQMELNAFFSVFTT